MDVTSYVPRHPLINNQANSENQTNNQPIIHNQPELVNGDSHGTNPPNENVSLQNSNNNNSAFLSQKPGSLETRPASSKWESEFVPEIQFKDSSIQPKINSKSKTSSSIISEIISICEKHVFSQTSVIQGILNVCSKIMSLHGCDELCKEINSACNQILTETYQNNHVIIDLCKEMTNLDLNIPPNVKKKTKTTKNDSKKRRKEEVKLEEQKRESAPNEEEDLDWPEMPVSDSEQDLHQDDDPDWTGYWENKQITKPKVKEDEAHNKSSDISDIDDYVVPSPKLQQSKKRSRKYKGLQEVCEPTEVGPNGKYNCLKCQKVFDTLKKFENHKKHHVKVTCEVCSMVCRAPYLYRHMRVHTGEKPYVCDVCGIAFADVSSLKDHMVVHSDEKPFQCDQCEYICKSKKRLRWHKIKHSTDRKYQCDNCGARFLRSGALKNHLLVHKDEWPFSCDVCPKKFKKRTLLRRHEQTHTNEYKYQCSVCGKKIRQAGNLKTHMRTHNGEKPYKCEYCGQGFAHNITCKQHKEVCGRYQNVEVLIQ